MRHKLGGARAEYGRVYHLTMKIRLHESYLGLEPMNLKGKRVAELKEISTSLFQRLVAAGMIRGMK